MVRTAAIGSNQHIAIAIAAVKQGRAAELAGLASTSGQQQHVVAREFVPFRAIALKVGANMLSHPCSRAVHYFFVVLYHCNPLSTGSETTLRSYYAGGVGNP